MLPRRCFTNERKREVADGFYTDQSQQRVLRRISLDMLDSPGPGGVYSPEAER